MKNTLGIILTGWKNLRLKELSAVRSSSAMLVGGKYRAIDFVLSNMVNSGVRDVGILTQYSFRSLMDHLGSGKEWDLDRRYGGLFIFPPSLNRDDSGWYKGSADAMFYNMTCLERSSAEYVIIAQGNGVYKMDFRNMLKYHQEKNADITVAYREMKDLFPDEMTHLGIIRADEEERILDFQEKPLEPATNKGSMGIYILKRELLISLLKECAAHGNYDFVKDVIIKKTKDLRIYGYRFFGYWRNLNSVNMYFKCNMELLNTEVRKELFYNGGGIYTKVKDETPAKYNEEAEVINSIVADGCIIEGNVENSVLFRGVHVKKGAVIRNSIIMQGAVIEEGVRLEYAILDKNVLITHDKSLKGEEILPFIVGKGTRV